MVIEKSDRRSPSEIDLLSLKLDSYQSIVLEKFDNLGNQVRTIVNEQALIKQTLNSHMFEEDSDMKELKKEVKKISEDVTKRIDDTVLIAFPGKDVYAHCNYHTEQNIVNSDDHKRKEEIKTFIIKSAVWSLLGILLTALWTYIKIEVKK